MKFGRAEISNFLTIGHAEVSLNDRGLVLIQGVNIDDTSADSNGAGKSSLADAVCWCLFGTTARGEGGDDVINETAGKDCWVMVPIEDDGNQYAVHRYRKHKVYKNGLRLLSYDTTGRATDLSKGADKLTQIEVEKLVGCSYEVFRASVYAGQGQMPDLPGMTDKNLKLLVEEAAGTTILDTAYAKARNYMGVVKADVVMAKNALDTNIRMTEELERQVVDLESRETAWAAAQKGKIAVKLDLAKSAVATATDLAKQLAALNKPAIEEGIKDCDRKIAAVASEQRDERALSARVSDAAIRTGSCRSKIESLKAQHDKAKAEIVNADHKVGCPCDECGRPITADEVAPAKAAATKRANEIAALYNAERKRLEDAIAAHKTLADELEAFRATMTDVSAISTQRASLAAELRFAESIERGLEGNKSAAKAAVAEVTALKTELNPYGPMGATAKLRHKTELCNTVLLTGVHTAAERKVLIAEDAVKVFSPTGVRGQVLDEVTPYLNDQTAKYLSTLSDGNIRATWTTLVKTKKGDLKEQFTIEVDHDKGGKKFGLISGGEQRKVQIACALALQDLVATRATKQIDLFMGDEIDNALDPAGLERLVQVLEEKARERGSVFIISHNSLKDWVANVITVVKEGGKSHIVEVTE